MTGDDHDRCPHRDDAGPWVLGALDDADARAFGAHLETCAECRAEVAALQPVADVLPMAAPQELPPPALKGRIMAIVEAEAELLRAAGPEADRVERTGAPRAGRERGRFGWLRRPLPAAALAGAALAAVVLALVVFGGSGDGAKTIPGFGPQGAQVALRVDDDHGRLDLHDMPAAPAGQVYQVWLVTGKGKPRATHALFSVPADGRAQVEIPESLKGTDQVLITAEPSGGSPAPTSPPLAGAKLA